MFRCFWSRSGRFFGWNSRGSDSDALLPTYSPSALPTFNTAKNAFCGIYTRPTRFIRFLPSCFSSGLRLRLMSPP
jgi:hypothetical protein